jgi:hypothetical protein
MELAALHQTAVGKEGGKDDGKNVFLDLVGLQRTPGLPGLVFNKQFVRYLFFVIIDVYDY